MRTSIRIAALLVSSALFVGCDSKSNTTTTPPTTPATPTTVTPPTTPDVTKTTSAVNNAIDKGADTLKTDANKLMSAAPTTKPTLPDMPALPK